MAKSGNHQYRYAMGVGSIYGVIFAMQILLNILLVLLGCAAVIVGVTLAVALLVYLFPMTEDEEKPPPPQSAVD